MNSNEDNFDYNKEIEAIEAQEQELAMRRKQRQQDQDQLKSDKDIRREAKEKKREDEWLGDNKQKSGESGKGGRRIAVIIIAVLILAVVAGIGVYAYKKNADKHSMSDFEQKVAAFQSDKLDGHDFGDYNAYFTDFMSKCQAAISTGDLKSISGLQNDWSELEDKYTEASSARASLDTFSETTKETLALYSVSDTYKAEYDQLTADIDTAAAACDASGITDFEKRVSSLVTNLKSDNIKTVQQEKNAIAQLDLDNAYVSADEQKQLENYSTQVDEAVAKGDYADAITKLGTWKTTAESFAAVVSTQKESEAKKAEEARKAAEAESIAAESRKKETETKAETETKKETETSNSDNNGSGSSGDGYIIAGSSSRYLSSSDVSGLSSNELMLARNEIYARHGRKFKDSSIQAYFDGKSWYSGTVSADNFSTSVFNKYELANITFIQSYE